MGWDTGAPADTGSEILTENGKVQANWPIIHTTVNVDHFAMADPVDDDDGRHRQVSLKILASDPNSGAKRTNTGFVYTKTWTDPDAAAHTEMYYMDSEASPNFIQMTKRGQPFGAPAAWCLFDNTGSNVNAFNATASRDATGRFTITFTNDMSGTDYLVVATAVGSITASTGTWLVSYHTPAAGSVKILTHRLKVSDQTIALIDPTNNVSVAIYDL